MTPTAVVLLAVAKELAEQAIESLPKLREGEVVRRNWYKDGKYYRETSYGGENTVYVYDFRQRKSRLLAVEEID